MAEVDSDLNGVAAVALSPLGQIEFEMNCRVLAVNSTSLGRNRVDSSGVTTKISTSSTVERH
jgi:hypothetical protein